jgi:hypothetical protein
MSDEFDILNKLAKMQGKPARTARDMAVLQAARSKAAITRQTLTPVAKKPDSFWSFLTKPMWLGSGSLAATLLAVFIVFGREAPLQQKTVEIASAPVVVEPSTATASELPVSPPAAAPNRELRPKAQAAATSAVPIAAPKRQSDSAAPAKQEASADVAKVEPSRLPAALPEPLPATPAPAPQAASAPAALAMPALASNPALAGAPSSAPGASGRMATAAPSFEAALRKRDSVSNVSPSNACISEIKAVPVERQNLDAETTRQLLVRCAKSLANFPSPTEVDWAKKLIDSHPEKLRPKPEEN